MRVGRTDGAAKDLSSLVSEPTVLNEKRRPRVGRQPIRRDRTRGSGRSVGGQRPLA
jgi:hypothetical protein